LAVGGGAAGLPGMFEFLEGGWMGERMPPAGGVGLLLVLLGGVLVGYVLWSGSQERPLSTVLIGLSMVAFGLSMLRSARRKR
jgi:hypothetical protein